MTQQETARRARRQGRRATVILVVTIVAAVVAVGSTAAAFVVRHQTDDLRDRATPIHRRVRELTALEAHAVRRLRTLRDRARETNQALTDLFAAEQAQVDASNHAVDVANQAVDAYNNARAPSVAAAFQGAGDAALADLEQRTSVVHGAAETARRVITSLQEMVNG